VDGAMNIYERRQFLAVAGGFALGGASRAEDSAPAKSPWGLLIYSYGIRAKAEPGFAEPLKFLEFAASRGASGVQMPLGTRSEKDANAIRSFAEKLGLYVEGIVSPPKPEVADRDRFASEIATAKSCGADVVRAAMLGGRRYEVFSKAEEYTEFVKRAAVSIRTAEPIAQKYKMQLAVENHKDFRAEEMLEFLKATGSAWVGICLDLGNNLALIEDPSEYIAALAPLAFSVHMKDIGVERAEDGFRMSEVPLGTGTIDVPKALAAIKKSNSKIRCNLEMITRDPLSIPCLTEKYWATLGKVPAVELARTLSSVGKLARKEPLPRVSKLKIEDQLRIEDANVRASLATAAAWKL